MTNHEATCGFFRQWRFSNATALDSFRVCAQDRSYTNKVPEDLPIACELVHAA
jgi:hypothetical protein